MSAIDTPTEPTSVCDLPRNADAAKASPRRKLWLWGEMGVVFFVLPGILAGWRWAWATKAWELTQQMGRELGREAAGFNPTPFMFPGLFLLCGAALVLLLRDPTFDRKELWRWRGIAMTSHRIVIGWLVMGLGLVGIAWVGLPDEEFFRLPRENPRVLLMISLFYPLLSVYPQGLLFRTFFFHRYEPILGRGAQALVMHALAFGFMHLIFLNIIAPVICVAGGLVIGWTYLRTRSSAAAWVEHSLYGITLFTCGLGWFFYGGSYGGVAG